MRNLFLRVNFLTMVFLLLFAGCAYSLPLAALVGEEATITPGDYGGGTGGGEFNINAGGVDYISFCLEITEHISYGGVYDILSVADYASQGGGGASTTDDNNINYDAPESSRDFLSDETKWVFWNYLTDKTALNLIAGGLSNDALADEVQRTIWQLEEETDNYTSSLLYKHVMRGGMDLTISGNVKVLNLVTYTSDTKFTFNQSQIVAEPVPEPATMLLFGTGLIGLAGIARRRSNKK